MTSCPVCGKQVDSLRAPAVSVRDGKVVSYCSKDCAALAESGPAKLIPTKMMRLPSDNTMSNRPSGEHKAVTPSSGVVATSRSALDSAPTNPIESEPSKPVVVVAPAKPRHKRADSSVQIADTGSIDDYVTHEPRRRGLWLGVLLLVVAGGAAAAYFLGYLDKLLGREAQVTTVSRSDAAVVVAIDDAAPTTIAREAALERAQAALRAQLTAPPRVQQLAAAALARTGDAQALDVLAAAIPKEPSDLAKIELAYQLARGGDKRGTDSLLAAASPANRESKHEAGRRFALLGDSRAVKILQGSFPFPQFRLGVAEQLAYLAEPRALKILDDVRADPKALPSEKARAAIALGWAGRADMAPALRELLAETRDNAYAAAALAKLKDPAARAVLVDHLRINTLRVRAARGLRQLAPDADVGPLLHSLVSELASEKDTAQVEIAEAVLLLAGPPSWSERE